jgi:hypothetical protein
MKIYQPFKAPRRAEMNSDQAGKFLKGLALVAEHQIELDIAEEEIEQEKRHFTKCARNLLEWMQDHGKSGFTAKIGPLQPPT